MDTWSVIIGGMFSRHTEFIKVTRAVTSLPVTLCHAYLSICLTLILRLIPCKWNFLAQLCRTQVSVDENDL